ncbi:2,3,4,5-tetrahydropyridine-2,6-dicarboxylate N-succinyltransferase [Emticicia fluvialis]|uniref:2,3,4,5-tetrahydropyridine-2,6-dicarboxylate N-succinyltransferase n=1 Tax=Emticicia fluvialis TaxID=2974474 RepID=UPI0021664829|nr:2,3,4,5-tetrahydropyridine-2,6-dicarboxylate N-succinyltransferase [Emticicia fluvialis]
MSLKTIIEAAWDDRSLLNDPATKSAIETIISEVNDGIIRVASPNEDGSWTTHDWIKKAIILYFPLQQMSIQEVGIFEYHDKMKLKTGYDQIGVRVVPPAVARYGSYLAKGVILMPSYVNIGAYVDSGTMVDTWATVGSCAQIGKDVHLSGGVGIGGVLEPAQASPVIIEDGAFVGSRCIVVEGARIGKRAVLGAGVTITSSSKIIDVNTGKEYVGYVPDNSVVIPGMLPKKYPAGDFGVPCALIIGQRKTSTDLKTSLNDALRENNVSV